MSLLGKEGTQGVIWQYAGSAGLTVVAGASFSAAKTLSSAHPK